MIVLCYITQDTSKHPNPTLYFDHVYLCVSSQRLCNINVSFGLDSKTDERNLSFDLLYKPTQAADHFPRRAVLAREFLDIPTSYINATLREKKFLYATYLELELVDRTYRDQKKPPYQKLKVMRDKRRARADRVADAARFDAVEMRSELDAVRRRREMQDGNGESSRNPHLFFMFLTVLQHNGVKNRRRQTPILL